MENVTTFYLHKAFSSSLFGKKAMTGKELAKQTKIYNLDAIIAVEYRIISKNNDVSCLGRAG